MDFSDMPLSNAEIIILADLLQAQWIRKDFENEVVATLYDGYCPGSGIAWMMLVYQSGSYELWAGPITSTMPTMRARDVIADRIIVRLRTIPASSTHVEERISATLN